MSTAPRRAEPPRIPAAPAALLAARADAERQQHAAERQERRSMVRGLLLVATLILAASIARAGLDRVLPHGWLHW